MGKFKDIAQEAFRPITSVIDPEFEALRTGRVRHLFVAQINAERALRLSPSARSEVDLLLQAAAAKKAGKEAVAQATDHVFDLGASVENNERYVAAITTPEVSGNPLLDQARADLAELHTLQLPFSEEADDVELAA